MTQAGFDLDAYLDRIGLSDRPPINDDGLETLHRAHAYAVPFENLSILLGDGVSVDDADIYDKIVRQRRGGYCFEVNNLFAQALRALGFQGITPVLARTHILEQPTGLTHRLTLLEIAGRHWIADVGFGAEGPRAPIPFEMDRVNHQDGLSYRLQSRPPWGTMLSVKSKPDENWQDLYSFTLEKTVPADFAVGNHFTSTHPSSFFTWMKIVTLPAPWGRTTLTDERLTIEKDGHVEKTEIAAGPDYIAALKHHFGIELNKPYESLKPYNPRPPKDQTS